MSMDRQPLVGQENSVELKEGFNMNTTVPSLVHPGVVATAPMPLNKDGRFLVGPSNTKTTCPFCAAAINTSISYRTTTRTHLLALSCCLLCCCCLPYCMDSARNTDHFCPNCKKYLGTYEK